MKRAHAILLSACLLSMAGFAGAQTTGCMTARDGRTVCPPPGSSCRTDRYGDIVCSSPGGGIETNRTGDIVCGKGYCAKDLRGDLFCSTAARGAASVDRYGAVVCAGGCAPASTSACVKPR